ncbi:Thiol-disulfide isomerase or thioredoxin [Raineyella antarctica]|uniref:Thiol-disulfide isomerase or thioredoxin n=1 Tax=Raineyella antarctica TaxID=1577474 RepID=A0A1G6GFK6_9ACTN|nr:TlpA disulfide reductase family protein [Raineyella antarctica]SDB80754.1 Thiol-disulfide isomerase or thioredoxin [Raineyella antarctica]
MTTRQGPAQRGRRLVAVAAMAAAVLVLAGCAGTEPVRPIESSAAPSSGMAPVAAPTADLSGRRAELGIRACPAAGSGTAVPEGLPSVATPCLDGSGAVDLSTLRGTPMVVNLWATWCGPCRQEAPFLAEVSAGMSGKVEFLGVDVADPDPSAALEFAGREGWTYPHVADPDRRFSAGLGVAGLPQTLLVDADGKIVYRHAGALTSSDQLRGLVRDHLGVG